MPEKPEKKNYVQDILTFKVGAKGGVSVYGLGRFPVTLYKEQWEKLFGQSHDIKKFISENAKDLGKRPKPVAALMEEEEAEDE